MNRWVLLAFLSVVSACDKAPALPAPLPAAEALAPSAPTRWVAARALTDEALLEAPARVLAAPESSAVVATPATARVVRVRVRPGQRVTAGEAVLDVQMPSVLQAAGALSAASLKLEAALRRKTQLDALQAEGLVRSADVLELDAQLASLKADAQAARASLRGAGVSDAAAEQLLSGDGTVSLRAPLSGVVVAVEVHPGEVREPSGLPLLHISGEGALQVEARLPAGLPLGRLVFVDGAGHASPLDACTRSPRLDEHDGTRLTWCTPSADAGLSAGAVGRARLLPDEGWVLVPAGAVAQGVVQVREGETHHAVPVQLVASSGADAIVVGVRRGAQVAVEPKELAP
jgi:multidrug efflux pump subunit AcrA (membrane-fusion protein)